MEPRLTGVNRNEVLLYLGYKGGAIAENIQADIRRCEAVLMKTARPRTVWRLFDLTPEGGLSGTDFSPAGNDVRALLKDCGQVILMGATLGAEVEALLRRTQVESMGDAVILDACASAAIENVCDNFCRDLAAELAPKYLTDRFSPGYGDMPFAQQADLCRVLDTARRIGVSLAPSGLMIPQKSVTALVGVADRPRKKRSRGCAYCNMFETCTYRKDNKSCGKN